VSEVGIVSIVLGAVMVCSRGALLMAPAATLRWVKGVIGNAGRTRALGAIALILGATMVWAGASEHSVLATILSVGGWAVVGMSTFALLLFPGVYRAIADAVLPSDLNASLIAWRILGLVGVIIGGLLIYFGALAL
jgi:hypothetical protein